MGPEGLLRLSRLTRPVLRRRTPLLYGICKLVLRTLCPRGSRPAGETITTDVPGGRMALNLSASLDYTLFFRGCHEAHIGRVLRDAAVRGGTCLDVGANVGAHTLVMAEAVGAQGCVIALEPHPVIGPRLVHNVALSGYGYVQVVAAVLTDKDGEVDFFGFEDGAFQQGMSSLFEGDGASNAMRVPAITGETLRAQTGDRKLDLIKIDVEGAESIVLSELTSWIERDRPHLVFEYRAHHWERSERSLANVLAWLAELGYTVEVVQKRQTYALVGDPPSSCELSCSPPAKAGA
jgi:FkbM family methyltransferase